MAESVSTAVTFIEAHEVAVTALATVVSAFRRAVTGPSPVKPRR